MKYNLTKQQKALARLIVKNVREGCIEETFEAFGHTRGFITVEEYRLKAKDSSSKEVVQPAMLPGSIGGLDALATSELVTVHVIGTHFEGRTCTLLERIYQAVDSDFLDVEAPAPISTLAQPHPPEIAMPLDRLRTKYPDPKKLGFLVMRFTAAKPFARIVEIIKETAEKHGLAVVRADEQEFHSDLWGNVRTYLHGCGFGVAVYERIETDEPNANVGLEVGYLLAMNKPVLLLKDKTLEAIQSDLAGKLYKNFDPHDPEGTVPQLLNKWLEDNGIIVPKRP
jgi:hypothetical protein